MTSEKQTWKVWIESNGFAHLFEIPGGEEHAFATAEWSPQLADKRAAWKFYTQLRTRIATQALDLKAGDEAIALQSIYELFAAHRKIIDQNPGCTHFSALAVDVMNRVVRPFTAQWHKWKIEGLLESADHRYDFREQLEKLQVRLRSFARLMAKLAGDESPHLSKLEPDTKAQPDLGRPIPYGIFDHGTIDKTTRDAINAAESIAVEARRTRYKTPGSVAGMDAVGLALSGGGIRSATFAQGAVQVLAREGILKQVDFLSTVSGGGYLGTFITSFMNSKDASVTLDASGTNLPFGEQSSVETAPLRRIRNHSKYLAEGGLRTLAAIVFQVLYGLFVALLLSMPLVLAAVWLHQELAGHNAIVADALKGTVVLTLALAALLAAWQRLLPDQEFTRKWAGLTIFVLSFTLLGGSLYALATLAPQDEQGSLLVLAGAFLFPVVIGVAAVLTGLGTRIGNFLTRLLVLTTPLLLWAVAGYGHLWAKSHAAWWTFWPIAGVVLFSGLLVNLNFASPHLYYRERLARTYMLQQGNNGLVAQTKQPLSEINPEDKAPYLLVNAAVNLPGLDEPELRGRRADFFLFSKAYCGSPIVGYGPTKDWEKGDPHLDLGTAMAISGAAASPNMGAVTSPRYTGLLAVLNIRLGYWLRRPGKTFPQIAWWYFMKELTGKIGLGSHINVSDGGHIENLGIYELLRRRCRYVIAVDGEADPRRTFGGLLTAVLQAGIDLGVKIELKLADLRVNEQGIGRSHFILTRIAYPGGDTGLLLYIKSSLTGNESEIIQKYKAEHPDFPHQTTAEQLFDETRFEAYRALGAHAAEGLFRPVLVHPWTRGGSAHDWFQNLAARLL
jgi:hypothetical protein